MYENASNISSVVFYFQLSFIFSYLKRDETFLKTFDTFDYSSEKQIILEEIYCYWATKSIVFNAISHTIAVYHQ